MIIIDEKMNSDTDNDKESINESEIDSNDENIDNSESNVNAGWADSIAKILKSNKPKGKKTLVLSKGKKLKNEPPKKELPKVDFEIETVDGKITKEKITKIEEDAVTTKQLKKKKELPNLRVKPNILNKDREKTLSKVATKGVVQLFNAIKTQQGDINKKLNEAGSMEIKRNKVLKNVDKQAFLDILMGEKSQSVTTVDRVKNDKITEKNVQEKGKQWNVFRDDFMMGAKLKDWDKELEKEEEMEYE